MFKLVTTAVKAILSLQHNGLHSLQIIKISPSVEFPKYQLVMVISSSPFPLCHKNEGSKFQTTSKMLETEDFELIYRHLINQFC